jgi:hypothetical protein
MCALSASRDTREIVGALNQLTVADNKTAYAGGLAAVDTTGKALPAADAAGLKVLGRFEHSAAAGEKVVIKRGIFLFDNKSEDPVVAADIGGYCYVTDDEKVQHTANSNTIVAGVVRGVTADGVYVDTMWYVDGVAAAAAGTTAGSAAGTISGAAAGAAAIAADLAAAQSTIKAAALVEGASAIAADLAAAQSTIKAAALVEGASAIAADLAAAQSTIKAAALVEGASAIAADLADGSSTIKVATLGAAGNVRLVTAPAAADSSGVKGDIAIDEGAIYLCTATNTWVKATLVFATWS